MGDVGDEGDVGDASALISGIDLKVGSVIEVM